MSRRSTRGGEAAGGRRGSPEVIAKRRAARLFNDIVLGRKAGAEDGRTERRKRRMLEELAARNIGTSVHFIPIHLHAYYRNRYGYRPTSFPVAYHSFRRMISLPLNPRLSDEDVADVVDAVRDVVRRYRR